MTRQIYVLRAFSTLDGVTRYLTDRRKFPTDPHMTSDLSRAQQWREPSGRNKFLKRNPILATEFVPDSLVPAPKPRSASSRKR